MSIPTRLLHYTMKCEIGVAPNVTIYAYRCSECDKDFHIDFVPAFCPKCGQTFLRSGLIGERVPRRSA
jgi:rRNA maturation endonuclease Nob1